MLPPPPPSTSASPTVTCVVERVDAVEEGGVIGYCEELLARPPRPPTRRCPAPGDSIPWGKRLVGHMPMLAASLMVCGCAARNDLRRQVSAVMAHTDLPAAVIPGHYRGVAAERGVEFGVDAEAAAHHQRVAT